MGMQDVAALKVIISNGIKYEQQPDAQDKNRTNPMDFFFVQPADDDQLKTSKVKLDENWFYSINRCYSYE